MTGEPHEPEDARDAGQDAPLAAADPASSHVAAEEPEAPGGARRWVILAAVVLLLVYPAARWLLGGGGPAEQSIATSLAPASALAGPGASELQLSFVNYRAGRYQEAVTAAKAAIAANPALPDAFNNLAVSYLGLKMYDDGIQAAQEAIRLKPDFQLARNNLAWIQQERARAVLPAVPAEQVAQAAPLLNQSLEHFRAGRYKECMDTAGQSVKLNPNSAAAFTNIGICAGSLHLWDEAIRNTQEALRLDPTLQLAKNNLAWMQQEKAKADGSKAK